MIKLLQQSSSVAEQIRRLELSQARQVEKINPITYSAPVSLAFRVVWDRHVKVALIKVLSVALRGLKLSIEAFICFNLAIDLYESITAKREAREEAKEELLYNSYFVLKTVAYCGGRCSEALISRKAELQAALPFISVGHKVDKISSYLKPLERRTQAVLRTTKAISNSSISQLWKSFGSGVRKTLLFFNEGMVYE